MRRFIAFLALCSGMAAATPVAPGALDENFFPKRDDGTYIITPERAQQIQELLDSQADTIYKMEKEVDRLKAKTNCV